MKTKYILLILIYTLTVGGKTINRHRHHRKLASRRLERRLGLADMAKSGMSAAKSAAGAATGAAGGDAGEDEVQLDKADEERIRKITTATRLQNLFLNMNERTNKIKNIDHMVSVFKDVIEDMSIEINTQIQRMNTIIMANMAEE